MTTPSPIATQTSTLNSSQNISFATPTADSMVMSPPSQKSNDQTPPLLSKKSSPPPRRKSKRPSTPPAQPLSSLPPRIGHSGSKGKSFITTEVREIIDEIEPTTPSTAMVQAYFEKENLFDRSVQSDNNILETKNSFLVTKSSVDTSTTVRVSSISNNKRKIEEDPTFENNKRTKLSIVDDVNEDINRLSVSSTTSTSSNISSASAQQPPNASFLRNLVNNITSSTFSFLSKPKTVATVATGKSKVNVKALKQAERAKQKEEARANEKQRQKEETKKKLHEEAIRIREEAKKKLHEKTEAMKREKEQRKLQEQKKTNTTAQQKVPLKPPVPTQAKVGPSSKNVVNVKANQAQPPQFDSKNIVYNTAPQIVPQKQPEPEKDVSRDSVSSSYEISDGADSSEDEDTIRRRRQGKKIPSWAQSENLKKLVQRSTTIDPDLIFAPPKPLSLEEVFRDHLNKETQKRLRARTSSQNWNKDTFTSMEELTYKRDMGFQ
jgi:hypothetical protein